MFVQKSDRKVCGDYRGLCRIRESFEETVKREIKEETNLDIDIKEFIGSYPIVRSNKTFIFIVFLAKALTEEVRRGGDVVEIAVLPPKEAFEQITGRLAKKAVADWLKETL
ncbi:MAG: NUDIX hydrolase [Candidatus Hermodarchaeota archaeon]